jgi:hypothetical protein
MPGKEDLLSSLEGVSGTGLQCGLGISSEGRRLDLRQNVEIVHGAWQLSACLNSG